MIIVVSFVAGAVFHFFISRRKLQHLSKKASQDEMSGLLNFQAFKKKADIQFDEAKRNNKCFAILLIDIDNLKSINDDFEYYYGDIAIKKLAAFLVDNFRSNDLIARFKLGDEFILMLENIEKPDLEKLIARLKSKSDLTIEDINRKVEFSIGYGILQAEDNTISDVISRAEFQLKEVKSAKHYG